MRITKTPEQRRAELITAARALFDEKGVAYTRINDIVKRVGVAHGVFYYYFPSKDDIVTEIAREVSRETDENAEAILSSNQSFTNKLAAFIHLFVGLVDQFVGDDETHLTLRGAIDSGLQSPAAQSAGRLYHHLESLVAQGVANGSIEAEFAWESAQAALFGIVELAKRKLPNKKAICVVAARALLLDEKELYKVYCEEN